VEVSPKLSSYDSAELQKFKRSSNFLEIISQDNFVDSNSPLARRTILDGCWHKPDSILAISCRSSVTAMLNTSVPPFRWLSVQHCFLVWMKHNRVTAPSNPYKQRSPSLQSPSLQW